MIATTGSSDVQPNADLSPQALAARLAERQQAVEQRALALERAKALLAERRSLHVERSTAAQVVAAAEARLSALLDEARLASGRVTAAQAQQETLLAQLAAEASRSASLQTLADAEAELQQIAAQPASSLAAQATAQRLAAEAQIDRLQRRRQIEDRLGAEREALAADIERGVRQKQAVDALRSADLRLTDLTTALTTLRAAHPDLATRLAAAEGAMADAVAMVEALQETLSVMTGAADDITEAVSTIVANLGPEDCDCPVCATAFPDPSVLRARAEAAAERLAPAIRQQQSQLDLAQTQRQERAVRRDELRAAKALVDDAEEALEAEQLEREGLRRRAEAAGVSGAAELGVVAAALANEIDRLERSLRRRSRWRTSLGAVDAAAAMQAAVRQRDEAVRVIAAEARDRADRDRRRAQLEADVVDLVATLFGAANADAAARVAEAARLATSTAAARAQQQAIEAERAAAEQLVMRQGLECVELEARRDETRQALQARHTLRRPVRGMDLAGACG